MHVTHRCQERRFLLKFAVDRKQYRQRLYEASRTFRRVRFLDYVITSNHIHLLLWVPRMHDLSAMMRWLQGTFARDYNLRKEREGSFWRGRFHPTLVQTGSHLSRCLFYLDMNMVRAGVVDHPFEWEFGGARELCGARRRYRIVDQERLLWCLEMPGATESFLRWHRATLADMCGAWREQPQREPYWASSFGVGDPDWLGALSGGKEDLSPYIRPCSDSSPKHESSHVLRIPQNLFLRIWGSLRRAKGR